jgi:hypothetical protein
VYKSGSWIRSRATRIELDDVPRLELLARCPTLLQEFVSGQNCRVHVVDHAPFCLGISSDATDFRFAVTANRYGVMELGGELLERIRISTADAGLILSGCDLKWSPESNSWNVLEINRMPAFEVFDHESNGMVADAIIAYVQKLC